MLKSLEWGWTLSVSNNMNLLNRRYGYSTVTLLFLSPPPLFFLLHTRFTSVVTMTTQSFVNVKSIEDYQRDRQCYLQTLLQVSEVASYFRPRCFVLNNRSLNFG